MVLAAYAFFWFAIFYPVLLPWFNEIDLYPLLATLIFEGLLFGTIYLISALLLGQSRPHYKFKMAYAMFAIYHVLDAVEPPFILLPSGADITNPSARISWDYGVGYAIQQLTGWAWPVVYWTTNVVVITLLIVTAIKVVRPQLLRKLLGKVLD